MTQARGLPREASLAYVAEVMRDAEVEVVWIDVSLHAEAPRLLQTHLDKTYSLCDSISFLLMQQRGIHEALTTDRHFDQAGFRRLLSP